MTLYLLMISGHTAYTNYNECYTSGAVAYCAYSIQTMELKKL